MARKKAPISNLTVSEKLSAPLAQRLNALITDPNALKDYLGCSLQAINQYKIGTSRPTLENLCKIAKFYHVSTDYLLGIDNDPTPDLDLKAIHKSIGLSSGAIEMLRFDYGQTRARDIFEIEDFLIRESYISFFATQIRNCVKNIAEIQELEAQLGADVVANHTDFAKWKAIHCFETSLEEAINEFSLLYRTKHPVNKKEYIAARKKEYTEILERIQAAEQQQNSSNLVEGDDFNAVN